MTMAIFSATQPSDWFSGLAGPGASLPIVSLLLGAVILFFGRRLFWLCVAAIGFAAGVELAPHLMTEPTPLLQLTIALVLGFIGALLATFLQKIAIAVAGFVAGENWPSRCRARSPFQLEPELTGLLSSLVASSVQFFSCPSSIGR